jgi:hypothetical protein
MKKTILSMIEIGLLLTNILIVSGISTDIFVEKQIKKYYKTYEDILLFEFINENEDEINHNDFLLNDNENVDLLWDYPGEGKFVFSSYINNDTIPDILASSYALDGSNGEPIYEFEAGRVIYVGDIDGDNNDEIITYEDGKDYNYNTTIYCLDSANGQIKWSNFFNSSWAFHASMGDIIGDSNNEIILCLGDIGSRMNHYIYCLDGLTGDIIWKRWTDGYPYFCEVSDVNFDGINEIVASTDGRVNSQECIGYVYCLNKKGNELWNFSQEFGIFRHLLIDNLNDDNYMEILTEYLTVDSELICISGFNGSKKWAFNPDIPIGSIQSVRSAELIGDVPGKEIVFGSSVGVFCVNGRDDIPLDERELWYAGIENGLEHTIIMSLAIGDIDKDGLLDVATTTTSSGGNDPTSIYTLNGQDGLKIWGYDNWGNGWVNTGIICVDLTKDGFPEVVAKDYTPKKYGGNPHVCAFVTNYPPTPPIIGGPFYGKPYIEYEYTFTSMDPDGDDVCFFIDWGDGTYNNWSDFIPSKSNFTLNHTWRKKGTYIITAKAKDTKGYESEWATFKITIPRRKEIFVNSHFIRLLDSFPLLKQILSLFL